MAVSRQSFYIPFGPNTAVSLISFTAHHFNMSQYVSVQPACVQLVQPKFAEVVKD